MTNKDSFDNQPFQQKITKPWGEETIYTPPHLGRTGKIIFIKAGHKLSLQVHDEKEETMCLFSGKALIWLENAQGEIEKINMAPGMGFTVNPFQKHRLEALEDSYILEVSAPETGTTQRLEDDYARPDETQEKRNEPNRGWKPKSLS